MLAKRDPRKDPRANDYIRIEEGWTRRVWQRNGNCVRFYSTVGTSIIGPFSDDIETWADQTQNAEVLHVAD